MHTPFLMPYVSSEYFDIFCNASTVTEAFADVVDVAHAALSSHFHRLPHLTLEFDLVAMAWYSYRISYPFILRGVIARNEH